MSVRENKTVILKPILFNTEYLWNQIIDTSSVQVKEEDLLTCQGETNQL